MSDTDVPSSPQSAAAPQEQQQSTHIPRHVHANALGRAPSRLAPHPIPIPAPHTLLLPEDAATLAPIWRLRVDVHLALLSRVESVADNVAEHRRRHEALDLIVPRFGLSDAPSALLGSALLALAQPAPHDVVGATHAVAHLRGREQRLRQPRAARLESGSDQLEVWRLRPSALVVARTIYDEEVVLVYKGQARVGYAIPMAGATCVSQGREAGVTRGLGLSAQCHMPRTWCIPLV